MSVLAGACAFASVLAASAGARNTGGYPNWNMPCEHAPYRVDGLCAGYDWGPVHNGPQSSLWSPRGYAYRNCTDFVAWKLQTANHFMATRGYGNAATWGVRARHVDRRPAVGAVAWWKQRNHVAWVKEVHGSSVTIQEYNGHRDGTYGERAIAASSPNGYIHFKDIAPPKPRPQPQPAPDVPGPPGRGDSVGFYFPWDSSFHLRNSFSPGSSDYAFVRDPGRAGAIPLVGDWDGVGGDSVGFYFPWDSSFHLRNSFSPGSSDYAFVRDPGRAGAIPLVGDWDGR